MRRSNMTFVDVRRQAFYDELVANGTEPAFAESLASWRKFPGESAPLKTLGASGTERPLHEIVGVGDPLGGVDARQRDFVRGELAAQGVCDLSGGRYFPGLAERVGDARAFIKSRSDMERVIRERGYGAEGLVQADCRERSIPASHETGEYVVANDLVAKKLKEYYLRHDEVRQDHIANPDRQKRVFEDLREFLSGRGSCPLEGWSEETEDGRFIRPDLVTCGALG